MSAGYARVKPRTLTIVVGGLSRHTVPVFCDAQQALLGLRAVADVVPLTRFECLNYASHGQSEAPLDDVTGQQLEVVWALVDDPSAERFPCAMLPPDVAKSLEGRGDRLLY